MKNTKIVATIGPASDTEEKIQGLLRAGANVFRFNMKHGTVEWHAERIQRTQKVADELGIPIGILIDLQGPEIRIETPDQKPVLVEKDETFFMAEDFVEGKKSIRVPDKRVIEGLEKGDQVLIDDGFMEFEILEKKNDVITLKAMESYSIGHRKGMNLPGVHIQLSSLIDSDLLKLDMAAQHHVDFVALSFVRDTEDIRILREEMDKRGITAQVVAKIENAKATENLDSIIAVSDAVMIARGDLGIEVPFEEISYWQKTMIHKCRMAGKPVITATQMLQSMIEAPRPTRAEVSDVANAIFDGTDAIMLSGESAQGKYPVLSVSTMRRIAEFNEEKVVLPKLPADGIFDQTETITHAAMSIVEEEKSFDIAAIVVFTETGTTARKLSRFRPQIPIIALTEDAKVRDYLTLSYGVVPMLMDFPEGDIVSVEPIIEHLKSMKVVEKGQRLLFIHGHRWREPGLTNTLSVKEVR